MNKIELLNAGEAAKYIGNSPATLSRLTNSGHLIFTEVGKRKLYDKKSLDAYLRASNLIPSPQDHVRVGTDIPEIVGVSFFSGAGGLDIGMENEGIPSLLFAENNRESRMTLAWNRPQVGLLGDISKITADDVRTYAGLPKGREIDVMHGGPPCQAFSTAGARRAFDDERGNVFLTYLDLATELRPKYLVIENVRGLLSTPFPLIRGGEAVRGGALSLILQRLRKIGYSASFNLYNSANFGVGQIRERVILIAKRDGSAMPWLEPTHSDDPAWGLPRWKTFGEEIEHLQDVEHHYVQFPEKRLRYFKQLSEGQYWKHLPESEQETAMGKAYNLSGGRTGFYRRIRKDRPSPTLVTTPTMPATDLCHPTELRPLSVEEYKAVQGFPSKWKIAGALHDIYRQVGNAVPVGLGEAIGRAIKQDIKSGGESVACSKWEKFPYSRYVKTSNSSWQDPRTLAE